MSYWRLQAEADRRMAASHRATEQRSLVGPLRLQTVLLFAAGIGVGSTLAWLFDDPSARDSRSQPLSVRPARRGIASASPTSERGTRPAADAERPRVAENATQTALPKPAPPLRLASGAAWAARPCPKNCSGHGGCNLDSGECVCHQGYGGASCSVLVASPCDLVEGDELVSRCAGLCDERELKCYCGGGKFPRRPMFQCEFRGIGNLKPWRNEGWNHARVAPNPSFFWSSVRRPPRAWGLPRRPPARRVGTLWPSQP